MRQKEINLTILYFFISLVSLFLILWLVDYSKFGLPEMIPQLQLRTYGILIMIAFLLINFLFQKQLLNANPEISIFRLIVLSFITIFFSLLAYQTVRQNIILGRPLSSQILISAAGPTLIFIFLTASNAFSLKKSQSIVKQISFALLLIIILLFKYYVKSFEW